MNHALLPAGVAALALLLTASEAIAACSVADAPDCVCFEDNMVWDPTAGAPTASDLLAVAVSTADPNPSDPSDHGVNASCVASGGKAFWMMQEGFTSSVDALTAADRDPSLWAASNREAWCSETVSFWHREAQMPLVGGYQQFWMPSWNLSHSGLIREWYQTTEELEKGWASLHHALWLNDTEINLYGVFGEEIPCPGNYQRIKEWDSTRQNGAGQWVGVHSHLIIETELFVNVAGDPVDLRIVTIDGNSGGDTRVSPQVWYVNKDLEHSAGTPVHGERRIDGWGIDFNAVGATSTAPSCDLSRTTITTLGGSPSPFVPPTGTETETYPWLSFAEAVRDYGLNRTIDGASTTVERIPQASVGESWVIDPAHFDDGSAVVTITWPADMPWTIDGLTMVLDQDDLTDIEVDVLSNSGTIVASESSVSDLVAGRIDVALTAPATARAVRLTFDRPVGVGSPLTITDMWFDIAETDTDAVSNP